VLGFAAALALTAAATSSGGVGPDGQIVGSGVDGSGQPTTVNRLDSNLLDDPSRTVGPTTAAVAAIDTVDADAGLSGDVPFSSRSRFRVVS